MMQVSLDPSEDTTANPSVIAKTESKNSLTASSLSKQEKCHVVADSSTTQDSPSFSTVDRDLRTHRSKLPLALYLLSFGPPFHPRSADVTWRDILSHPYVLYAIGTLAALPAGLTRPALNLIYGYWTTGVTAKGAKPGDITARGDQVGWILVMIAVVMMLCSWTFVACCECSHNFSSKLILRHL
jgi:hypothetical protein